jgi:O-antigen/teichoic acid export membrane protein
MSDPAAATLRRVGRNTAALLLSDVAGRALAAAYRIALAEYLGRTLFGEYSFALSVSLILGVLADLGLSNLVTREVARDRDHPFHAAAPALAGRLLLTLLFGGAAVLVVALTGRSREVTLLVAILVLNQVVTGPAEILAAAHRGRERMGRVALVMFLTRTGLVVTGLVAILAGAGILTFAWIAVAWSVPAVVLLRPGLPGRLSLRHPKRSLRIALPIGLGAVFWTVYFRMDVVLLAYLKGAAEAGLYAAPFLLVEAVLLLQGPLLAAAFPVFARDDSAFDATWRAVSRILLATGPILAALLIVEGDGILDFLLGAEYAGGGRTLALLAATIPISFVAAPRLALLVARNRERTYATIMAAGAGANLVLDLFLIPRYGAEGAATATLATEVLVTVLAVATGRRVGASPLWPATRAIGAAVILGTALLVAGNLGVAFGVRLAAGLLLGAALALAVRGHKES